MEDKRTILFKKKIEELLKFIIEKDKIYAGSEPCGNIKDNAKAFDVTPIQFCKLRINEKWNRIRQNPNDTEIAKEEFRDIWGYTFLGLILIDMEVKE